MDNALKCNPDEAPKGFYAVLKSSIKGDANLCRSCDWRKTCQDSENTDFVAYGHRCMAPAVLSRGEWFKRDDGCSVVFKKREGK